jgi:hypothetical protein
MAPVFEALVPRLPKRTFRYNWEVFLYSGDDGNFVAVLEIGSYALHIFHNTNPKPLQLLFRTDTAQFEKLWCTESSSRDDDLSRDEDDMFCAGGG